MESIKKWRQFLAAILVNLLSISLGNSLGWSSPVGPKLADESLKNSPLDHPISVTSKESGWIASLLSLGAAFGPFIVCQLIDRIGRKWCLFIGSIFYLTSYTLLVFTSKLWMILVARLFQGLGVGFCMAIIPIYQGEISSSDCRGAVGALFQLFFLVGISYVFIIGPLLSYTVLQWACIPFPILFILQIWLIPESPYYFILKGKINEAEKSLQFLRGQSKNGVQDELETMRSTIEKLTSDKRSILDVVKNKGNLKAMGISLGLICGQQLCGSTPLLFNIQTIFEASKALDVKYSMIMISIVHLIVGILASFVADRFGRRTILMMSAGVMSLTMTGLGTFFYLQATSGRVSCIQWLPITCLVAYITAFCLGFGPIPWIILANLASANVGICMTWSSPSIVKLTQDNSPLGEPINSDQQGWITSFMSLGAVFGPFISWLLLDRVGRKWCLLSSSVFFLVSTVLLICTTKLWIIYIARFFQGLTTGVVMATQPVYNAEIATDDYRGAILSLMPIFMLLGFTVISCLGSLDDSIINYSSLQWVSVPFCILFPVTFIFMPESPYYYIAKGNQKDAKKSLKFLRGQSENGILEEYGKMKTSVEESLNNKGSFLDLFKRRENLKALTISLVIISFQQMSGASVITFNSLSILLASKSIDPLTFNIVMSILQLAVAFIPLYTLEKFGRKTNLLFSSGFMALSLFAFGVYFRIQKSSDNTSNILWLPSTCLIVYAVAFGLGFSPIPWVLVGELFASDVKSFATSLTVCTCWAMSFIMSKLYPIFNEIFGLDVVMWIYGIFSVSSFIFVIFFVFETKGISLQEIQNKLSGK